jgi:hypothetical protein
MSRECIAPPARRHDGRRVYRIKFFARRGSRRRNGAHAFLSRRKGRSESKCAHDLSASQRQGLRDFDEDLRCGILMTASVQASKTSNCSSAIRPPEWALRGGTQPSTPYALRHARGVGEADIGTPTRAHLTPARHSGAGWTQFRSHPLHPDAPSPSRVESSMMPAGAWLHCLLRSQRGCGCHCS